jgi:Domain of unknown function (DUF4381)
MSAGCARVRRAWATALLAASLGGIAFGAAPAPVTTAAPSAAADGAAQEDIRDIRGPKYLLPAWLLPAVLAGSVLAALGLYGAWRWHRRQRAARVLRPFEQALEQLEAIRPLMAPKSVREYSIAVSDIVRRYIEIRFDVTAAHRTTEEFLRDRLGASDTALARHHNLLAEFLQCCDLAKFAGLSLSLQSMESLQQSARSFVLETAEDGAGARSAPAVSAEEAHDSLPST